MSPATLHAFWRALRSNTPGAGRRPTPEAPLAGAATPPEAPGRALGPFCHACRTVR